MKYTRFSNHRVVVEPRREGNCGRASIPAKPRTHDEAKRMCESIAADIKRHVDDIQRVDVEWDSVNYCSHCGNTWEVDERGVPVCCDSAVLEYTTGVPF